MRTDLDERLWRCWPDAALRSAYVRAFGDHADDLDVDFVQAAPPEQVTDLLQRCWRLYDGSEPDLDQLRQWSLPRRLHGLLAVAMTSDIAVLKALPHCQQCAQRLEIEVAVRNFIVDEETTTFDWSPQPGQTLSVRLPTGQDQQRWLASADITAHSMAQQLVVRVNAEPPSSDWRLPEDWVDALADELAQHDPLTALELPVRCPACEATTEIEFNLEEELLAQLRARQFTTLHDIHILASVYHWSESEILKLPAWRRRQYLAQLAAGGLV